MGEIEENACKASSGNRRGLFAFKPAPAARVIVRRLAGAGACSAIEGGRDLVAGEPRSSSRESAAVDQPEHGLDGAHCPFLRSDRSTRECYRRFCRCAWPATGAASTGRASSVHPGVRPDWPPGAFPESLTIGPHQPWYGERRSHTPPVAAGLLLSPRSSIVLMGFRRYRGPVDTVEQAAMADLTVYVRCLRCGHEKMFWTRGLMKLSRRAHRLPLREPVSAFRCQMCRSDEAVISAPVRWV